MFLLMLLFLIEIVNVYILLSDFLKLFFKNVLIKLFASKQLAKNTVVYKILDIP